MEPHAIELAGGLTLRPVEWADIGSLQDHWSDPVVRRFLWDGEAPTAEVVRSLVEASRASFAEHGYGMWAMVDPAHLIGMVALTEISDDDFFAAANGAGVAVGAPPLEILYSLQPARHGAGVTTMAAGAVLNHVFALPSAPDEIWAGADGDNTASIAVMRRLGMRYRFDVSMPLGPGPYWSVTAEGYGR